MIKKIKLGSVKQRIGALIIAVAVLIYAVYHVTSLFGEDIATIASGVSVESTVLDGKGYIFRDETVLYSKNSGVADYYRADGSKVSVGDEIAAVSSGGTQASKNIVRYLDEKISLLEKSVNSGVTLAALPDINDDISDSYYALARILASGDTGDIAEQTDKLLYSMNCHSILVDENSPVAGTLKKMREQRKNIFEGAGKSVVELAPDSGYFYSYVDGYEDICTLSFADSITVETYYELSTGELRPEKDTSGEVYGKLAHSNEWRFVMRMPESSAGYFKLDERYSLRFVENGNVIIPMTVTAEVEDDEYGGKIIVFSADRLPDGFIFDRCQSVSVTVDTVSGIYVPRSAIHRVGGKYCVYVLKGSVVTMRRIDLIYETKDYCLSAVGVESDGSLEYLGTNELLIVKGNNLFDGRILD